MGLDPNMEYQFVVTAVAGSGADKLESDQSNKVTEFTGKYLQLDKIN